MVAWRLSICWRPADERSNRNYSQHRAGLAHATEAATLAAGRWAGLGRPLDAERVATEAMIQCCEKIEMDGIVRLGEADRWGEGVAFATGQRLGTGRGPKVDLLAKALEGNRLLAGGHRARRRPWPSRRPGPSGPPGDPLYG